MNLHLWRLFLDAADHGSLSKVAVLHGTSQPHVSRQIADLERLLVDRGPAVANWTRLHDETLARLKVRAGRSRLTAADPRRAASRSIRASSASVPSVVVSRST